MREVVWFCLADVVRLSTLSLRKIQCWYCSNGIVHNPIAVLWQRAICRSNGSLERQNPGNRDNPTPSLRLALSNSSSYWNGKLFDTSESCTWHLGGAGTATRRLARVSPFIVQKQSERLNRHRGLLPWRMALLTETLCLCLYFSPFSALILSLFANSSWAATY